MNGSVITGDANNDGSINMTDVVTEKNYILGLEERTRGGADINEDGSVNIIDCIMLKDYLAD